MIRKIRAKEYKAAGHIYCSFCRPLKVKAIWRKSGFCDPKTGFACEKHKGKLKISIDDNDYSEADYQTWLKNI